PPAWNAGLSQSDAARKHRNNCEARGKVFRRRSRHANVRHFEQPTLITTQKPQKTSESKHSSSLLRTGRNLSRTKLPVTLQFGSAIEGTTHAPCAAGPALLGGPSRARFCKHANERKRTTHRPSAA